MLTIYMYIQVQQLKIVLKIYQIKYYGNLISNYVCSNKFNNCTVAEHQQSVSL